MMKKTILLVLVLLQYSTFLFAQSKTAIICGNLISGNDNEAQTDTVILVEGDSIAAVGSKELLKPDYNTVGLSNYSVLPGLIDPHVHPLIFGSDYQTNHLKGFLLNPKTSIKYNSPQP